jgi:tagatose 1,6-diphosphate aldolase
MALPPEEFRFFDPGPLGDGELSLVVIRRNAADPAKGWVPSYDIGMIAAGHSEQAGRVNLRAVTTPSLELYGGHFGYTVEPPWRGRHFAERAVRLLLPLARRHGLSPVWISCDPENHASRRTCERLGGTLVEIVDLPPENDMYIDGERRKCRYRIDNAGV